jgi:hypothetical protein
MTEDVVRARRIELADDQDRTRATLSMEGGQPSFGLHGGDERRRVMVSINPYGNPILLFRDAEGNDRITLTAYEDGSGFVLSDPTHAYALTLAINQEGMIAVNVKGHGENRVIGAVEPDGDIHLVLSDAEGNVTRTFSQVG